MNLISRVRGTQDILNTALFDYVVNHLAAHLSTYNFSQNATPIIEPLKLFKRSLGTATDVISKEMFLLQSRQESDEVMCLRPESTAPTMRSYLEHAHTLPKPWKTFSYGPCFRYERPQKGRYRQFHQANIEIVNSSSWIEDVCLLSCLERFFAERLELKDYVLSLNFLGCVADRAVFKEDLALFLKDHTTTLCSTCLVRKDTNILRIFDCKQNSCKELYRQAKPLLNFLCNDCSTEWTSIQEELQHLSVSYVIDTTLVRGFDYYDKIVFEFCSMTLGAQNAFCGGGRYNGLAEQLGASHAVPSIGAAIGIERVLLMLESQAASLIAQKPLYIIIPLEDTDVTYCLLLADHLRAHQLRTDIAVRSSVKHMMRQASSLNAAYALLVGSQERESNSVSVKNMSSGEQTLVNNAHIIDYLTRSLF